MFREKDARGGNQQKHRPHQQCVGGENLPDSLLFFSSKQLGREHRQAGGKSRDHRNKKIIEGRGGSDSGQCQLSLHISHDKGVHPVKKLLEQSAHDERQRKEQERFCRAFRSSCFTHTFLLHKTACFGIVNNSAV